MAKSKKGKNAVQHIPGVPGSGRFPEDMKPALAEHDRVTVQFAGYYQHLGSDPLPVQETFSVMLETKGTPLQRPVEFTEAWTPLEYYWVDEPGLLVLVNKASFRGQTKLSEEEKDEIRQKVLEVRIGKLVLPFTIPPGYPQPFYMDDKPKIEVRCRKGNCPAFLSIFPR